MAINTIIDDTNFIFNTLWHRCVDAMACVLNAGFLLVCKEKTHLSCGFYTFACALLPPKMKPSSLLVRIVNNILYVYAPIKSHQHATDSETLIVYKQQKWIPVGLNILVVLKERSEAEGSCLINFEKRDV